MCKLLFHLLVTILVGFVIAHPTVYMKNNDKLSPGEGKKFLTDDVKLITAKNQKLYKSKVAANVKPISREAYETKGYF
uniref:Uncharacterized protein n=1 Tax=Rhodnius prolixus TaxID=13249 RepID=T1IA27_RHOPR